eukprot:scaffold79236_cov32-Tisochrysis_lutea.AAC.4
MSPLPERATPRMRYSLARCHRAYQHHPNATNIVSARDRRSCGDRYAPWLHGDHSAICAPQDRRAQQGSREVPQRGPGTKEGVVIADIGSMEWSTHPP